MGARNRMAAALLAVASTASPAGAIDDLSGVWTGTFTCGSTTGSATVPKAKADATLYLEDFADGSGGGRARFNNATVYVVPITIVSGADAPGEARIAGVMCGFDQDMGGSFLQGLAKVKSGSGKGTLTGELVTYGGGVAAHLVSVCRFKVKRTGPLPDPLGDCSL